MQPRLDCDLHSHNFDCSRPASIFSFHSPDPRLPRVPHFRLPDPRLPDVPEVSGRLLPVDSHLPNRESGGAGVGQEAQVKGLEELNWAKKSK